LTGLDAALRVPRRATPRTRVPSGAVAIAGEFTAIYPRAMPGGWRILGHTAAPLWDLQRDPPALLPPLTDVQFRPVPR
jgi:allophanate hydrolase subunit 1